MRPVVGSISLSVPAIAATSPPPVHGCLWVVGCGSAGLSQLVTDPVAGGTSGLLQLLPIVLAAAVWGHRWAGAYILCHSDNMAAVAQVNSLHAWDGPTAHLLRCLAFTQADCWIRAVHIPGHLNINADDLSHNKAHAVRQRLSLLSPQPTQVPPELLDLLLQGPTTWASETWRQQLTSFWRRV